MMNKGFQLAFMEINLHVHVWDFIDEFNYEVAEIERGLYDYLLFCEQTGISYKTLVSHSELIILTDVLIISIRLNLETMKCCYIS